MIYPHLRSQGLCLKLRLPFSWLFSERILWFWLVIALTSSATVLTFLQFEEGSMLSVVKILLCSFYLLFIPGYSVLRASFSTSEIGKLEQFVFSLITSISIIITVELVLSYVSLTITAFSLTLSIAGITMISQIIALLKEQSLELSSQPNKG